MRSKRAFVLIVAALAVQIMLMAQDETIVFDFLSANEGLPNNDVSETIQDHAGIIWIGTFNGLIRHDGFSFELYRSDLRDSLSISGNNITSLSEDHKGRLWLGTSNAGLNYSDLRKKKFYTIASHQIPEGVEISTAIYDIVIDNESRIWVAGNKGLHIVKEEGGEFKFLPLSDFAGAEGDAVDRMGPKILLADHQNRMWIGTNQGLCWIDLDKRSVHTPASDSGLPSEEIDDVRSSQSNQVWLTRKSEAPRLMFYDEVQQACTPFDEIPISSPTRRAHFTFDKDNRLWVAVFGEQLYGYDFKDSTVFLQSHENSNIQKERFIRRPFVDRSGNVWVQGLGFFKYNYPKGFKNYLHPLPFGQSNTCIYKDVHQTWLGYREAGLICIDESSGTIKQFSTTSNTHFVPANLFQAAQELSDGRLGMAAFGHLIFIDKKNHETTSVRVRGSNNAIYQDRRGFIWMGGILGLIQISAEGEPVKTFRLPPYHGETRNFIQGIVEDDQENIWFASDLMGLAKLDAKRENIVQFLPDQTNESIVSTNIIDLALGLNNVLWIGTDRGLVHLDLTTETFTTYGKKNGFNNEHISAIVRANDGIIWVSTTDGISSFNPDTKQISNYSQADGLLNRAYYEQCRFYYDGTIYFGGENGVDFFHPEELRSNYSDSKPGLIRFTVNNQRDLPVDSLLLLPAIDLNYTDDLVEIEFGTTDYKSGEEMEYSYRMSGLVDDWVLLQDQRRLLFPDMPSGSYELQVRSRMKNQSWSSELLGLTLNVSTPIWNKWWFRGLLFITLLSAVIWQIKRRESRIKKREQEESRVKQALLQLEKKALLAQMNPHFIFNSMNAIQQFMTEGDSEGAMRYLSKFSRLLRQMLHVSSKNKVSLGQEIKLIEYYLDLERLRYPARFTYSIHIAPNLDVDLFEIPPLLVHPHVESATQSSLLNNDLPGKVKLSISRVTKYLRILIEDNGQPSNAYSEDENGRLLREGVSIVEERLRHLNQEITSQEIRTESIKNIDGQLTGTRVELLIDI